MKENEISPEEYNKREREGVEEHLRIDRSSRACAGSVGSHRAETCIPGTGIPKRFYTTITIDLEAALKRQFQPLTEVFKDEAKGIFLLAEKQLREYKKRWNYFQFYGCDVGDGFVADYSYYFIEIDGIVQLLRGDLLPIGMRSINALMDWIDGRLEPDKDGILKPVK